MRRADADKTTSNDFSAKPDMDFSPIGLDPGLRIIAAAIIQNVADLRSPDPIASAEALYFWLNEDVASELLDIIGIPYSDELVFRVLKYNGKLPLPSRIGINSPFCEGMTNIQVGVFRDTLSQVLPILITRCAELANE